MPQVTIELSHEGSALGVLEIADHEDFPLALDVSIASIRDITKRSGVNSKSFKVPASKQNNQVLRHLYQISVSATTVLNGVAADIKVDGTTLFYGRAQVSNLSQTNSALYYELEFAADNLDWTDTLKELKINQLEYNNPHIPGRTLLNNDGYANENLPNGHGWVYYTRQTAEASWHGSVSTGWDYVYSLKNYGQWQHPYSHVTLEELRPDIYLHSILTKAFAKAGYTIESDFLNTTFFKRLVLPYGSKFFRLQEATTALYSREFDFYEASNNRVTWSERNNITRFIDLARFLQFTGNSTALQFYTDSCIISAGIASVNINGLGFNMNMGGSFDISIGMNTGSDDEGTVDVYLAKKNPNGAAIPFSSMERLGHFDVGTQVNFTTFEAKGVVLQANQDYMLLLYNFDLPLLRIFNTGTYEKGYLKMVRQPTIKEGNRYNLASVLPEVPVLDMVTGLANMFNLYFQTDNQAKTVRIEPRDRFYHNYQTAVDWSAKLDVGKPIQTTYLDNYKRDVQFIFKDDGADTLVRKLKEQNRLAPGSLSYTLPPRFKAGKQELGNKTFAFTEMRADNSLIPNAQGAATYLPHFWSGEGTPPEPSYDFAPRVLYYAGLIAGSWQGKPAKWGWYRAQNLLDTYPVATRHAPNHELAYNTPTGFVAKYYQNDVQHISEGKLVTAYFRLQPSDIRNLDLRRPIYINHPQLAGYYLIQTVSDYIPTRNEVTKVELIPLHIAVHTPVDFNQQVAIQEAEAMVGIGIGIAPPDNGSGKVSVADLSPNTPSVVLQNGSNNTAVRNGGAIAFGNGTIALKPQQHVLGNFNVASTDDIFQIGAGTSHTERYRALTFTQEGNFLVQGGYLYTSDGREIMFASQRNERGQPKRFDKLHLKGDG